MLERIYSGPKPDFSLPAGVIDTQLHLYKEGFPAQPGGIPVPVGVPGLAEYRQVMEWLGIERFVITQGNTYQFDNSCLLDCLQEAGEMARGVAVVTAETSEQELQQLHAAGVRGARIMDLPAGAAGLSYLPEVDKQAHKMDWCVAVQFDGSHLLQHLPLLESLQSRYIIDHHGKFFAGVRPDSPQIDALKRLIDKGNCWFKFAGCYESSRSGGPDYADIAAVAREMAAYAPQRIIWGTNFPHNMAQKTEDYPNDAHLLELALDWAGNAATQRRMLVDNPQELFFS
ncbi:MAG: amidohydrolase family protein [Thiolinea sp.]